MMYTKQCHWCHRHSFQVAKGEPCPWCCRKPGKYNESLKHVGMLLIVIMLLGIVISLIKI